MDLRCVLVDDNSPFLEETRLLLEQEGVTVVGTASSTAEALLQARALCPDVVLVDIALGAENGFDLVRRLADDGSCGPLTAIMISTHSAVDYAELIFESPAAGFLPKEELSATAIRRILRHP
jgi:DNA-binding NarL/FixJ family response regulator